MRVVTSSEKCQLRLVAVGKGKLSSVNLLSEWFGTVGASIRFCQVSDVKDRVWHVLDISHDSPAHRAGLVPHKDWIMGSPEIALNSPDDFYNLMIHNQKRPVRLLVFNIDLESVREAIVIPDFQWGGEGCLGCDVASGALHRIPPQTSEIPPQGSSLQPPQEAPPSHSQTSDSNNTCCIEASSAVMPTSMDDNLIKPIPGFEPTTSTNDDPFSLQ